MIYEHGIKLLDKERSRLFANGMSQDRAITLLFKQRPDQGFTFHDVVRATGFNQDSVKRCLSNLSGAKCSPDKYKDEYGRYPLVKTKHKKRNPDTGINIHVFTYNTSYGQLEMEFEK